MIFAVAPQGSLVGHAAVIGPDAFGYRANDTGPFSFTDISGTGTAVLPDNAAAT